MVQRRLDVADAKVNQPVENLVEMMNTLDKELGKPLSLFDRVIEGQKYSKVSVAAEFKRASPSKGNMDSALAESRADEQAVKYADAGASVISILTEPKWFKGTNEDMLGARKATQAKASDRTRPAILKKDFIIDEYQLYEARAFGADTVLLMHSILKFEEVEQLIKKARALGMEPLVEVANDEEMHDALKAGAKVIGVNNRNLHTFTVDMSTTTRMVQIARNEGRIGIHAKDPVIILALSGVKNRDDVVVYEKFGDVAGILVGETLMRSLDPKAEIHKLIYDKDAESSNGHSIGNGASKVEEKPLVKICGISNVDDARFAAESGANLIGLIFAPSSKRLVTIDAAKDIVSSIKKFRERSDSIVFPGLNGESSSESSESKRSKDDYFVKHAQSLRSIARGWARPLIVGVFMDQPIEEVNKIANETGIDIIQLHGSESIDYASQCNKPVIKVLHVHEDTTVAKLKESIHVIAESQGINSNRNKIVAVLLDTTVKGSNSGGTGMTFDWNIAKSICNGSDNEAGIPLIVAGGLKHENVKEAVITIGSLLGVDVASGVEANPRAKDKDMVKQFIRNSLL